MFGSTILDVLIGLAFVYALLSLICSSLTEVFSQVMSWRAKTLEIGVRRLLTDDATRDAFYRHPLIKSLSKSPGEGERVRPSYIPSRVFALALLDVVAPRTSDPAVPATSPQGASSPPAENDLHRALRALVGSSDKELEEVRKGAEIWFDDVMDRVSGWYKRKVQWVLLVLAVIVTGVLNADTITLANQLWQSPELRAAVVEAASAPRTTTQPTLNENAPEKQVQEQLDQLTKLGLPLGWGTDPLRASKDPVQWFTKVVGLLLTALAVSLGAPFWFDLVNKFVNVRSTGKIPAKSTTEEPAVPSSA